MVKQQSAIPRPTPRFAPVTALVKEDVWNDMFWNGYLLAITLEARVMFVWAVDCDMVIS